MPTLIRPSSIDTTQQFEFSNVAVDVVDVSVGVVANGTLGASGQVLTSNGTSSYWGNSSGGASAIADLTDVDLTTPPTDGQALVYDTTTSMWMPGSVASGGGSGAANTRIYTGTGAQTVFGVTSGVSVDSLLVTENGLLQLPNTDYTVAGANITFTTAPANGVVVQVRELGSASGITTGKSIAMAIVFGG